jgi:glycosyltransferase 2 family protein
LNKRWIVLLVRIVLSAVMLAVLLWRVPDFEASELVPDWRPASALWLVAAVLLTVASIALSAVRWQQVLHALDRPIGLRPLLPIYFAGQFVSNVLPSTIGGDVLRVARLTRINHSTERNVASVVLERLTGWLVLPVMSLIGLVINRGLLPDHDTAVFAFVVNGVALLALVVVIWLASHQRILGRFTGHDNWLRFLGSVHLGIVYLRKHPADAAKVLVAGFAYQTTLVLAALCAARVIGIDEAGITAMLAFIPVVLMVQVLPIGISGLGLREASLVLFLEPLGVPNAQAIALGLALYLLNVISSLLGAPAFALGGRHKGDEAADEDGDHEPTPYEEAELGLDPVESLSHLLDGAAPPGNGNGEADPAARVP